MKPEAEEIPTSFYNFDTTPIQIESDNYLPQTNDENCAVSDQNCEFIESHFTANSAGFSTESEDDVNANASNDSVLFDSGSFDKGSSETLHDFSSVVLKTESFDCATICDVTITQVKQDSNQNIDLNQTSRKSSLTETVSETNIITNYCEKQEGESCLANEADFPTREEQEILQGKEAGKLTSSSIPDSPILPQLKPGEPKFQFPFQQPREQIDFEEDEFGIEENQDYLNYYSQDTETSQIQELDPDFYENTFCYPYPPEEEIDSFVGPYSGIVYHTPAVPDPSIAPKNQVTGM